MLGRVGIQKLLQIFGNINIQILQCLGHGSLDVVLGPSAGNLPSSTDDLVALRINDPKVPPSGVFQTTRPFFHRLVSFGIGSVLSIEGAGNK